MEGTSGGTVTGVGKVGAKDYYSAPSFGSRRVTGKTAEVAELKPIEVSALADLFSFDGAIQSGSPKASPWTRAFRNLSPESRDHLFDLHCLPHSLHIEIPEIASTKYIAWSERRRLCQTACDTSQKR